MEWMEDMADLSSAEEFFELFEVPFDPERMMAVRLHVLTDFHQYIQTIDKDDFGEQELFEAYQKALKMAWEIHANSDAAIRKRFEQVTGCSASCGSCG